MNNYEEKKQRKIDRYKRLSGLYEKQSEMYHQQAHSDASFIPFGQPILIGHHSEKRDRAYRARIERRFKKSFEFADKKYWNKNVM